jgi:predicted DNA-binding transcriptional regulator YafY
LDDSALFVSRSQAAASGVDLARVRQALREQRKMRITYADQNETAAERTIWPIMLGFIESQRFIAGWCELRANFGLFRTDQIAKVDFLEERYARSRRQLVKEWRAQAEHPCRRNDCS